MGRWWDGDGERTTFRVTAVPDGMAGATGTPILGGTYELCYCHATNDWTLAEVQD